MPQLDTDGHCVSRGAMYILMSKAIRYNGPVLSSSSSPPHIYRLASLPAHHLQTELKTKIKETQMALIEIPLEPLPMRPSLYIASPTTTTTTKSRQLRLCCFSLEGRAKRLERCLKLFCKCCFRLLVLLRRALNQQRSVSRNVKACAHETHRRERAQKKKRTRLMRTLHAFQSTRSGTSNRVGAARDALCAIETIGV